MRVYLLVAPIVFGCCFISACQQSSRAAGAVQPLGDAGAVVPPHAAHEVDRETAPSDREFLQNGMFALPLVPTGPTSASENRVLAAALRRCEHAVSQTGARDSVADLSAFIAAHPQSVWNPALLVNLGTIYRQTGHFSRAYESWQAAWTLTEALESEHGRAVGDAALSQLSQLQAYLGRQEELSALLDDVKERPVVGTAAELLSESARGLADMRSTPELSFKCGPFALSRILQFGASTPDPHALDVLQRSHSTARGLSLSAVHAIALRAGMHYQMAFRTPGASIVLPAVAHWKVGHYAAIVANEQARLRVQDSTFGEDIRMSAQTLDEEASGYFLIPEGPLAEGWRAVTAQEGERVWGRGDTGNNKDNGATGASEAPALAGSGGACPAGCTMWSVEPMVISLALHDVPVGHTTPIGPAVRFDLHYSQRDVQQPQVFNYANLGRKWTTSWLSYVTDNANVNGTVELYRRGGGNETFGFEAGASTSLPGVFSQTVIVRELDASGATVAFRRTFSDGSQEVFSRAFGTKFFMTQVVDPWGNTVRLEYDEQVRIVSLTDAIGQLTKLAYELASDPLKITKVTDPFGRSATFAYNANGNLESVTDTLGITSKYTYGSGDFITTLETPYGKTSFEYGDSLTDKTLGNTRYLVVTDALGRKSRVEFRQAAPGIYVNDNGRAPSGMNAVNDFLQWRNTFVWNAEQYAAAGKDGALDYTKARIIQWLHTLDNSTSRVAESIKNPLEGRLWFDYAGQTQPMYVGKSAQPGHIGRVLDDGSNQLATFEYNAFGKITLSVDPQGRSVRYEYANNGIDLVAAYNVTGGIRERLIAISWDDKHRPLTVTSPNGAVTRYEYNTTSQITKVTDALNHATKFTYDAHAQLAAVEEQDGERETYAYDAVGRLESATDVTGDTIHYEYDAADRLTRVRYADGTTNEYGYTLLDPATVKDRAGNLTEITVDAARQLTQIKDAMGRVVKFNYDLAGNLTLTSDAAGRTTMIERDLQGRPTVKHLPDGTLERFGYERALSRLHSVTDALNQTLVYTYNLDDSVAAIASADATARDARSVQYTYDKAYARLSSMSDGNGETRYEYNPLGVEGAGAGELAAVTSPVSGSADAKVSVRYAYDLLGRVTSRGVQDAMTNLEFDALGRVSRIRNALDNFAVEYADVTDRIARATSEHGPQLAFSYDDTDVHKRLRQIVVSRANGKSLANFGYRYDRRGLISAFAESYLGKNLPELGDGKEQGAGLMGRSAPKDPPAPPRLNPAFWLGVVALLALLLVRPRWRFARALGPMVLSLWMVGSCSEPKLGSVSGIAKSHSYRYDQVSRLTSAMVVDSSAEAGEAPAGDARVGVKGAALRTASYEFSYDEHANLTAINAQGVVSSFKYSSTNTIETGRYDANGSPLELEGAQYRWDIHNRLSKITRGDHDSEFVYDGWHRIVRIIERVAGKIVADHAYTWCGAARCLEHDNLQKGSPVSKQYFAQGFISAGKRFYYVRDHLGSVRQVIDDTGRVRAQYDYDPYGRVTKLRGDIDSDVGYAGYFQHGPSGLALTVLRAYDPAHGRWLNRDPIGEAGDLNMYAYVAGNPINATDPLGLYTGFDDAGAIGVGALTGLAVQAGLDIAHGELSSWQDYAASAVGGAAGAEAALYTGPVGAGAAAGAASNLTRQGLNWATGKQCGFSWTSLAVETGVGALGGAIAKGVGKLVSGASSQAPAKAASAMCFAAGTLVDTEQGLRAIESVQVGERVWARNEVNGQVELRSVTQTFVTQDQALWGVELESDGGHSDALRVTAEHPFLTTRGWVAVSRLRGDDRVLLRDQRQARVLSVRALDERATVYNFEVEGLHNYFVGESRALVHNTCASGIAPALDELSQAGRALDPADKAGLLTKAGRALQKHRVGGRPGSTKFPGTKGGPASWNEAGQHQLDDILTTPGSTTTQLGRGGWEVRAPDGRAARFNADGTFSTFVE